MYIKAKNAIAIGSKIKEVSQLYYKNLE